MNGLSPESAVASGPIRRMLDAHADMEAYAAQVLEALAADDVERLIRFVRSCKDPRAISLMSDYTRARADHARAMYHVESLGLR